MSGSETIFRQEALDSWIRGRDRPGGVVRLGAAWHTWTYRGMLLLVVAGLAALWLVTTQEQVSGPAVVDQRSGAVTALLPAAHAPELTRARALRVEISGHGGHAVAVVAVHARQADDAAVRRAGLSPLSQPGVLLIGRLADPPPSDGTTVSGTASASLRPERLVDLILRQFRSLLSGGEAAP